MENQKIQAEGPTTTDKAKPVTEKAKTVLDKAKEFTDKGSIATYNNLRNCTITDSCIPSYGHEGCGLTQVQEAYRATGHILHYTEVIQVDGVTRLKYRFSEKVEVDQHSALVNSIVKNGTSVRRSRVKTSLLQDGSVVWRSAVSGSTVSHSQLCRATLTDCDVEECVISRSNFKGMTLKYGVWKNGRFVRGVDDREPVAIASDGTVLVSRLFHVLITLLTHFAPLGHPLCSLCSRAPPRHEVISE